MKWNVIAKFTVSGAVGKSKLVVQTEKIDFGIVAVAQTMEKTYFIQNEVRHILTIKKCLTFREML